MASSKASEQLAIRRRSKQAHLPDRNIFINPTRGSCRICTYIGPAGRKAATPPIIEPLLPCTSLQSHLGIKAKLRPAFPHHLKLDSNLHHNALAQGVSQELPLALRPNPQMAGTNRLRLSCHRCRERWPPDCLSRLEEQAASQPSTDTPPSQPSQRPVNNASADALTRTKATFVESQAHINKEAEDRLYTITADQAEIKSRLLNCKALLSAPVINNPVIKVSLQAVTAEIAKPYEIHLVQKEKAEALQIEAKRFDD